MVYTSGFDAGEYYTGVVYGLHADSGVVQWRQNLTCFDSSAYAPQPAAAADGLVFFGGAMQTLWAFDASTGKLVWNATAACAGHLWSVPLVINGVVYVGCDGGDSPVLAFDSATGAQQWSYNVGGFPLAARSPAVADGRLFVGVSNDHDNEGADKLVVLQT
jgi:outer membrane protein assembly factor BamB